MPLYFLVEKDTIGGLMVKNAVLTGNPNCGKTTIFNALTGSNQYVGNWPGVTVEKKTGKIKKKQIDIDITDLPGIYSISPYSMEEVIAEAYIRESETDLVINVVDTTAIERSLFLTLQLIETGKPLIAVFNMMDVIEKEGTIIDVEGLQNELGIQIIPLSARKNKGMDELLDALVNEKGFERSQSFQDYLQTINDKKSSQLVEDDEMAQFRYGYIKQLVSRYVILGEMRSDASKRIDKVLTHQHFGIPLFLFVMWIIYYVAINLVGGVSEELFETVLGAISSLTTSGLQQVGANETIISLVVDGVISGVGAVLLFLPQIMVLFFFISILEDSGYMARVSFILDKVFRKIGLTGKSFIPMFVGSGCSVPGIMAARTLDSEKERKMTIVLTPFISCGAKMPIYIMFAAAFFPGNTHWIIFSMYGIGFFAIVVSGLLMKHFVFKGHREVFLLELPDYRTPVIKNVLRQVFNRSKAFITKAGTIIFAGSVLIWFLQSFTPTFQLTENPGESMLGYLGAFISPIFRPLGFSDWKTSVAFLTGFVAKEMVVATLAVLNDISESGGFALLTSIREGFTASSALSFMTFIALASPCIGALGAAKRELNSWKWTGIAILYQTGFAYIAAFLVYNMSKLFI